MGFMAVRKDVFDKLKYPFFDSELVTITKEDGTIIRDICSEDVSFCKKITQAGFQIMINTDISLRPAFIRDFYSLSNRNCNCHNDMLISEFIICIDTNPLV